MTTVDDDEHEISFRGLDKCRACHLTIMTRVRWSKVTAIVQLVVVVDEEVLCIISRQELPYASMIAASHEYIMHIFYPMKRNFLLYEFYDKRL